jgi:asparagine synthase (glutamine-hydrolysing)
MNLYANPRQHPEIVPPWISAPLRKLSSEIDSRDSVLPSVPSRLGIAPHQLDNSRAWWSIMETLPHLVPQILSRPEYRYPFLDKDLVTFLFSIPREQIVRPGRRRSLMRRALINIVPHEILERRRKAFQLRAPLNMLHQAHSKLENLFSNSALADAGFIDVEKLGVSLRRTAMGDTAWWQALLRTIAMELWLRACLKGSDRSTQTENGRLHLSLTA